MSINNEELPQVDETQPTPAKKTPKVRKAAVDSGETGDKGKTRRSATKAPAAPIAKSSNVLWKNTALVVVSFLLGSAVTYFGVSNSQNTSTTQEVTKTFTEVIAGKVALSESELVAAVNKLGVDVYWAGPVDGAKYTLAVPADGQAYVRYLPNGQGLEDTSPNYVVIATYTTQDAFNATQAAGNQKNGVSFINSEGAAVYYSKEAPTNVYVAYPNLNYQIEVFNPIAQTALDIASKPGALRLVK